MTESRRVAVIGGDGIGPEVVNAAIPIIDHAGRSSGLELCWDRFPLGAEHYLATSETLPDAAFKTLSEDYDAILLGALGDPRVPGHEHARDILLGLRTKLDLYINLRPCSLIHPSLCPLRADPESGDRVIDMVIFRENTEGSYQGRGRSRSVGAPDEEQVVEEIHSAPKVERIIRSAFEWARRHGRTRVTMSDKSNAIPAHRMWQRIFEDVGREFSEVEREHLYIDALAMQLVRDPARFEVIVTNNLFGDIISDLGAELVGGLGLAASANLHPGRPGLFEPVHGSAPTLTGRGLANPMAAVLTGAMLLRELGYDQSAESVEHVVKRAVQAGATTRDLGGPMTTGQVAEWMLSNL